MKELRAPTAVYHNEPGNRGMTADVLLTTSHGIVHFWDEAMPGILQLDLYSCAEFDPTVVFGCLSAFDPLKTEYKFLDRDKGLRLVSERVVK